MKKRNICKLFLFFAFLIFTGVNISAQCTSHPINQRVGTIKIVNGIKVTVSDAGYTNYDPNRWCEATRPYSIDDAEIGKLTFQFCPSVEEAILNIEAINSNFEEIVKIYRNGVHYKIPELGTQISCIGHLPVLTEAGNLAGPPNNTEFSSSSIKGLTIPGPIEELTIVDSITVAPGIASTILISLTICAPSDKALPINNPELIMSFDTSDAICRNAMPYILKPQTSFDNEFYIDDLTAPSSEIQLNSFGVHLIKTDIAGCPFEKTFRLSELCNEQIYIPTAFSPNGDRINDLFQVFSVGIEDITFSIYNRWGAKVFETKNLDHGWDGTFNGKRLPPDSFFYHLDYSNSKTKQTKRKSGTFALVK